MSTWTKVGSVQEFAEEGQRRVLHIDGVSVVVFCLGDRYVALEDVCTHDGGEIASGELVGDEIVCPRHGARFCVRTGEVRCPPAYEPVTVFPVKVDEGAVWVRDDRWE
jgi:3-phenylpropionate/trans-cinnamate dioxygenase ferredoxin component